MRINIVADLDRCQQVWQRLVFAQSLFDLWEIRACFQEQYGHRPRFLVAEDGSGVHGLLALSEIEDHGYCGCFPGETWGGKTWLEQNRIIADTAEVRQQLLEACPAGTHLRYLVAGGDESEQICDIDETGYLFHPAEYDHCFETYLAAFSGKSRKRLRRELAELEDLGVAYRHDDPRDIDRLFDLNLQAFGGRSYFADERFLSAFRAMAKLLSDRGRLRITTVILGGAVAAIDMGAVYRGAYTVLAGGTDMRFPGVAKLINLHHIEWACQQRFHAVDFLCGDFGWKERFHLTARPLYQIRSDKASIPDAEDSGKSLIHVA
ncbi:MAG: GNAT family N-acetyltransferase [Phycisphaerae bacterium]|nr:GNAT family N-acetyltransferase [Phycisphaerae bacterium]